MAGVSRQLALPNCEARVTAAVYHYRQSLLVGTASGFRSGSADAGSSAVEVC